MMLDRPKTLVRFALVSLTSGETDVPGYIDAGEVFAWHVWKIDESTPGMHRSLRGKTVIAIQMKAGAAQWTLESFDEVSAKLLEARGQFPDAKTHKELADGAKVEKSRFAV
jgi:hypothetical protein